MIRKFGALTLAASMMLSTAATAERGADGQLNILYWQAVSTLNPYLSGGSKDREAASMVVEPLARYDETGRIQPWLVDELPTVENGGISEDLTSITWKLSDGILWSDGTPLTAEDVVFTADYCMDPAGACQYKSNYEDVEKVEALDDRTVKVTFSISKPFPYGPFVGAESPIIQKAQYQDCAGTGGAQCTTENFFPIGTGPFKVTEFRPNDVVLFEANENFRDSSKPRFQNVVFKGGGDAASAARAVFETGEFDYAWNLQVEPEILDRMLAKEKGTLIKSFAASVERLMINQTDPSAALGDTRSTTANAHPFLADPDVTRALSLAINRDIVVEAGYGEAGRSTCNLLASPQIYASDNNDWCLSQNVAEANALLDKAGWELGSDGVRSKDGQRLSILFQTSTNSVRQGTQALVKQWWSDIGVETELRNIDGSVFFGGDTSSPDTYQKFYADVEMYTDGFPGADPQSYMAWMTCDDIPSPENNWLGNNIPRHCSAEYDALVSKVAETADFEQRIEIFKSLNDMLIDSGAIIPLVHRGDVSGKSNALGGVKMNSWDSQLWNVADWYRVN